MKKNLFMTAAAIAALLTGCSTDEEIANIETSAKNAIGFNIVSNGAETKATIHNTGSTNFDFDVFAFNSTTGDLFMGTRQSDFEHDGVDIYYNTTDQKWDYKNPNELAYWPSDGSKLSFYAISPATVENEQDKYNYAWYIHGPIATGGNKIHCSLTNEYGEAAGAKNYDLMYATAFNYEKSTYGTKVKLTFKHALSQVHFKGQTSNAFLEADIQSITIQNTKTSGTFTIPTDPTDLLEGNNNYARDPKASDWTLNDRLWKTTLNAKMVATNVVVNSTEAIDLSKEEEPILVIPQVLTPWSTTPGNAVTKQQGDTDKQSYLIIAMKLTQNGQYVIGTKDSYQTIYVPFNNGNDGWQPGKRYIYTLNFGGGYDDQGKPILTPITFDAEVKDWSDASGYNVQVK